MAATKNVKIQRDAFLFSDENNKKTGIVFFSFSVFFHGLFFISLLFFHDFKLPKPMPPVIQIDLVSFTPDLALGDSAPLEKTSDEEGISLKKSTKPPKKSPVKHIKADISLKQKPKNLKELMAQKNKKKDPPPKKEPKPEPKPEPEPEEKVADTEEKEDAAQEAKALKEAQERLAKELEEKNQQQIDQALARLKNQIKDQGKGTPADSKAGIPNTGKKGFEPIDLYNLVIESSIKQNWVFNETLARMDKNLEVRLIIKILKNGEIRDVFFETRSGNRYLDESAKRAIEKSSPLPALPGNRRSYDLGLIFTPRGLK